MLVKKSMPTIEDVSCNKASGNSLAETSNLMSITFRFHLLLIFRAEIEGRSEKAVTHRVCTDETISDVLIRH